MFPPGLKSGVGAKPPVGQTPNAHGAGMAESRFSLGQVVGVAVGVVALAGVAALGGGVVGYQVGKADGQSLASAELLPFGLGSLSIPRALPAEGQLPSEFGAPKAYLGVRFEPVSQELAELEQLGVAEGAIIREVTPDSPAAKAGLKVGDVVTAVNDEPVDAQHTLRDRVAAHLPNDTVELSVRRGAETLKLGVTLGQRTGVEVEGYQFRVLPDGELPFFGDPSNCLPRGEQG